MFLFHPSERLLWRAARQHEKIGCDIDALHCTCQRQRDDHRDDVSEGQAEPNRHLPGSWCLEVLSESPNPLAETVQGAAGLKSSGALEDLCVAQGWMWLSHLHEDKASLHVMPKTRWVILSQRKRTGWTLGQLIWCKSILCSAREVISGCCLMVCNVK